MAYAARVRQAVHDLNPNVALADEIALDVHVRNLTAAERLSAFLTLALAVLGLVLLATGCVSLFVSMVRDSSREIAIRLALGATRQQLVRRVLFQGIALTVLGLGIGTLLARSVAQRIADQLHETPIGDALTWITVPTVVTLVCLLSVYSAGRLAARTDPSVLLRSE
jgi:ABC-type antimicrobial peptide transport system permease subunit